MKLKQKFKTTRSFSYFMLTLLVSLSFCVNAQAQSITVKGVITSEDDNLPIPGVSVLVQGTNTGTISDFDGNFSVKAKMGAVLHFSYLGMSEKFVTVKSAEMKVAPTL